MQLKCKQVHEINIEKLETFG